MITRICSSAHHIPCLDDESVDCIITSPPYYGLRQYTGEQAVYWPSVSYRPMPGLEPIQIAGCAPACEHEWKEISWRPSGHTDDGVQSSGLEGGKKHQARTQRSPVYWRVCGKCGGWSGPLGLEPTLDAYIGHMILIFREMWRVLKPTGTAWVVIGDSYSSGMRRYYDSDRKYGQARNHDLRPPAPPGVKPKDLLLVPHRLALALQADGWYVRSDIIWHKPNAMPESVKDRPTQAHEHILLLAKAERYYYNADAIREPHATKNRKPGRNSREFQDRDPNHPEDRKREPGQEQSYNKKGRNKRNVWTVATEPYPGEHFATYPRNLVRPCILAGCPPGGTVLDPFHGTGTTGVVALELGRNYVGVEISDEYLQRDRFKEPIQGGML